MRNIYLKLTVPVLCVFVACSTNQPGKTPAIPEIKGTAKVAVDSGSKEHIATRIKKDTTAFRKQKISNKVVTIEKTLAAQPQLPDLPQPPHFENEDVNKGVQGFAEMVRENLIAEQNHDSVKMALLKEKMGNLPANMTIWIFKMSSDERKSFKAYLEKVEKIAKDNKDNEQQNS